MNDSAARARDRVVSTGTRTDWATCAKRNHPPFRASLACLLSSATFAFAIVSSNGQAQISGGTPIPGEFQLYEENDAFYFGTQKSQRSDRWYTQGIRAEWTHASNEDQEFIGHLPANFWCNWLCGRDYELGFTNAGWAVGQNVYTPQIISIPTAQPADRPWAGYLYGSRLAKQSYMVPDWNAERQDRFEISIGVVGPLAGGNRAQNGVHRILGIGLGKGWNNQLDNEPTIVARYDATLRFPACARFFDFQPYGRASLGTVLTAADLGATVRVGYNLAGFARGVIPGLRYAQATNPTRSSDADSDLHVPCGSSQGNGGFLSSFAAFGRFQARAVANNIFLDGNTFGADLELKKHTLVYENAVGFDVVLGWGWGLALQLVNRTAEFEGPPGTHGVQKFGAIQIHRVNPLQERP